MYNPAATPQQHVPTLFSALLPGAAGSSTPLSHLTAYVRTEMRKL
jgi:hypothetical protein